MKNGKPNKPDGTFQKLLDSSIIKKLGWKPTILLEKGLMITYGWFIRNRNKEHVFKE